MVTLFPHQVEAIESLNIAFDAGINRAMANLATGTGKTIMALEWMRQRGGKGIFVCPFDAVVQQSFEAAYKVMPNKRLGIVQAERDQHHADIIVASLHTIQKEKRLQRLAKDFDSIVIDEAHLMPEAYIKVLEALENQHSKTLGLSATPYRLPGSKIELTDIWQATPVIISIEDAVDKGFLATPTGIKIQLKDADFSGVKVKRGDFDQKAIETVMDHCNWKEAITEEWRKHAGSRRTLAYVGSVNQAHALSEYMRSVGIRAESLDGSISNQRPAMKARFERGETQVLVNVGTLTTGFDAPCTDAILMARFTTSRALYVQIVGRGLRNYPGKTDCLILDVVGNFKKHPTLGFDDLVGAKKRDIIAQPETMAEARSRAQQELFEETQKQLEQERLEAIRVELIRKKQEERARQNARNAARWIEGDYRHTYEVWDRVFTIRPSATGGYKLLDTKGLFQEYPTVDEAKAAAAPLIQKATFADPNAPWRRRSGIEPASEAQRRQLDRFRVRYQPDITKAEASDLLNAVFARLDAARQKL